MVDETYIVSEKASEIDASLNPNPFGAVLAHVLATGTESKRVLIICPRIVYFLAAGPVTHDLGYIDVIHNSSIRCPGYFGHVP